MNAILNGAVTSQESKLTMQGNSLLECSRIKRYQTNSKRFMALGDKTIVDTSGFGGGRGGFKQLFGRTVDWRNIAQNKKVWVDHRVEFVNWKNQHA